MAMAMTLMAIRIVTLRTAHRGSKAPTSTAEKDRSPELSDP